jgi:hypothetical protein
MATLIQAIATYRPRIKGAPTIELDALAERMAVGTLVTRPLAQMFLDEIVRQIEIELRLGHKIRLGDLGTFGGEVRLDASLRPWFRYGAPLKRRLATAGTFHGRVTNREAIGMDAAAIKVRWDAEHPGDPVVWMGGRGDGGAGE